MLTGAEKGGNIVKLSRGSGRAKEHRVLGAPDGWRQNEKSVWQAKRDMISYKSSLRGRRAAGWEFWNWTLGAEKLRKSLKKVLDSNKKIWYNKQVPAAEAGRAPCKLNNVKKHEAPEEDKKFSWQAQAWLRGSFKFLWSWELGFNKIDLRNRKVL